jgi:hypothetical protein
VDHEQVEVEFVLDEALQEVHDHPLGPSARERGD